MADTDRQPRFSVGQCFVPLGKVRRMCKVIDILRTYNMAGELVKLRYVATHPLMGQVVTDCDVTEATIARGLIRPDHD